MNEPGSGSGARPYVIGFVIGAVVLTLLPLLQRQFLRAPPPVMQLTQWTAGDVSSTALAGKVVLMTVEPGDCSADCVKRLEQFGSAREHVSDLSQSVVLVTLVDDVGQPTLSPLITKASGGGDWRFGKSDAALLAQLQKGLTTFLERDSTSLEHSGAIVLIDQTNAVRGYWQGDVAGRGNAINAARLLAKRGPQP